MGKFLKKNFCLLHILFVNMDNLIKVRVGGPSVHGPWVMYGQVMALEEWREEVSSPIHGEHHEDGSLSKVSKSPICWRIWTILQMAMKAGMPLPIDEYTEQL